MDMSQSDTAIDTVGHQETPPSFMHRIKRRRDEDFACEISELKAMLTCFMQKQDQDFKKNTATLKEIQQTNLNIKDSVAYLSAQNEEFKRKIENLEGQIREDRKYINILEGKIEDMQKDCRKSNFEIKNVPKKSNESKENLIEMIVSLSENVGSQLTKNDVKDIYRIRGKNDNIQNTPIVVETSSTFVKNDVLKMCKSFNLKHKEKLSGKLLGFRSEHTHNIPIFVSEHLTAKASRLHFLARDLVKSKQYKFCWTAYGKVYVRKDETSAIIQIKNESQIQLLGGGS